MGRTTKDGTTKDGTTKDGTVSSTDVLLDLTQNLDKYRNLGGVAGQNDGTLEQCTYSGTMGGNADTDALSPSVHAAPAARWAALPV